jgi:Ni/Fe-hydrogenase subunit HybB-like protein
MFKLKITFWRVILALLLIAGLYATVLRFFRGLGASTNLSDAFPWGIWVGFDVMCGVMLAAGGFTLTAAVYIFNLKKFKPIVRPTVLTAFLGYQLVVVALLFDLGRGYRFQLLELLRIRKMLLIPLVIAGVLLSTLHQSSLGSLYLIVPNKLHPFWYSPLLPVLFFLSAICVGLAMTIFESSMSAKHFGKQLELPLIQAVGRTLLVMLCIYTAVRFQDLLHRGALEPLSKPGWETSLFVVEILFVAVLPIGLLLMPKVRESPNGLYLAAVLCLLGFVTNRMNVAITGMEAASGQHYFPKWTEIAVTLAIVAFGFFVFALAVKHLPIFGEDPVPEPTEEFETVLGDVPELSNVRS